MPAGNMYGQQNYPFERAIKLRSIMCTCSAFIGINKVDEIQKYLLS